MISLHRCKGTGNPMEELREDKKQWGAFPLELDISKKLIYRIGQRGFIIGIVHWNALGLIVRGISTKEQKRNFSLSLSRGLVFLEKFFA